MPRRLSFAACAIALLACRANAATPTPLLMAPRAHAPAQAGSARRWTDSGRLSVQPDPRGPDESALRYYASQNQTRRVELELRRLQTLYPNWKPPKNIYAARGRGGGDESALWALFAADKLDELRAAIAQREQRRPGWRPSSDLENKLRIKATHDDVASLWRQGRWKALLTFVKSKSYDAAGADTQTLWTIAAAYAKAKQTSGAVAIYTSLLNSDNNEQERLATFQKAMAHLPMSEVEPLLAMARRGADGKPEYEPIMNDIIRARIVAYLHDERTQDIPADQLHAFEAYAKSSAQPNEAGLVAWYFFKLKAFDRALSWFKIALANGGDAMIAHGLANSLAALGYDRQAEEVAYAWRRPLVNNDIFFVDIVAKALTRPVPGSISAQRLARYARVTMDAQSGEGAQALAWYAYNSCQFEVSLEWFQRAVAWHPDETSVRGYALTLLRLGKKGSFYTLINRYDGLFPQLLDLIFPDGSRHAPTLCERRPPGVRHGPAQRFAQFTVPGSAQSTQAARDAQIAAEPSDVDLAAARRPPRPKIDRAVFPVSTAPQNPLRVFASGQDRGPNFRLIYLPEPSRGPWPLVARRVPGVGPMPYEKYGYTLLPGWDGVTDPTWPPYSAQPAPPGTLAAKDGEDQPVQARRPHHRSYDPMSAPRSPGFGRSGLDFPRPAPDFERPASPSPRFMAPAPGWRRSSRRDWEREPTGSIRSTAPAAPILAGADAPPLVWRDWSAAQAAPPAAVAPPSEPAAPPRPLSSPPMWIRQIVAADHLREGASQ
ncbi:MAG TPA: hypothetical protein VND97_02365 [Beijerinckiaceae bacterium]|nr:hypothetical protein [Beijerinckiaceae bacterium]